MDKYKVSPPQCTCTTDKEMTCIVHPTTRSLKEYIARLEAELDKFKNGYQGGCYACETVGEKNVQLEAENAELRLEIIAATGQAQMALEENAKLKDGIRFHIKVYKQVERGVLTSWSVKETTNRLAALIQESE